MYGMDNSNVTKHRPWQGVYPRAEMGMNDIGLKIVQESRNAQHHRKRESCGFIKIGHIHAGFGDISVKLVPKSDDITRRDKSKRVRSTYAAS